MIKTLTITCSALLIASIANADTTTTETCANGGGIVITGAVSTHKYCLSKNTMNWWNSNAWCDAMGRRLARRSDCACGNTKADCANDKCPDLTAVVSGTQWGWILDTPTSTHSDIIPLESGNITRNSRGNLGAYNVFALCY